MPLTTPLHDRHVALGARMVDFGGWDMPLHYGSQVEEHHAVRRDAGLFDVSHMCALDVRGPDARACLRHVLANDVQRLQSPGKALYSCLLDERGGIVDDLIACFVDERWFRVVVNAGTADKDIAWLRERTAGFDAALDVRRDLAMVAVQGPRARERAAQVLGDAAGAALGLGTFFGAQLGDCFVARTGYTGEDGFEIALPAARAPAFWDALVAAGVRPCGLGARDTLRLEAGMNLYGSDMDERVTPLESGLAWTVSLDDPARDFIGRAALEAQLATGVPRRQVGLLLEDKGVLRAHQRVIVPGAGDGEVTSGTWSPTLERSIALARVPAPAGGRVQVDVRGKLLAARVVKPPFVRHGRAQVSL